VHSKEIYKLPKENADEINFPKQHCTNNLPHNIVSASTSTASCFILVVYNKAVSSNQKFLGET